MEVLKPYLLEGLSNTEETQVCAAAVGVVTDLSRALEKEIFPYMDELIAKLIFCLQVYSLYYPSIYFFLFRLQNWKET